MRNVILILCLGALVLGGCAKKYPDERINIGHGVGSAGPSDNIITRPFGMVISALLGEGIEITDVIEAKTPEGFIDVQMKGYNKAYGTKKFEYRVEWVDANGMVIPTHTSVWIPVSALGKSNVTFRFIAPRKEAVDFTINTRKNKKI
ncbi:MAG: DUF1425 domain-containing protein [Planctomycetota bacterium]